MSRTFTLIAVLALGYFAGVKFPGLAQKIGMG